MDVSFIIVLYQKKPRHAHARFTSQKTSDHKHTLGPFFLSCNPIPLSYPPYRQPCFSSHYFPFSVGAFSRAIAVIWFRVTRCTRYFRYPIRALACTPLHYNVLSHKCALSHQDLLFTAISSLASLLCLAWLSVFCACVYRHPFLSLCSYTNLTLPID